MLELPAKATKNITFVSFPFFFSTQGTYKVMTSLYSSVLQNSRDVIVYFPPSTQENPFKK